MCQATNSRVQNAFTDTKLDPEHANGAEAYRETYHKSGTRNCAMQCGNFEQNEDMALADVKRRKQERNPNVKRRRRAKEAPETERVEAKGLT